VRAGGASGLEALAIVASELEGEAGAAAVAHDSASRAPYLLPEARHGSRLGAGRLLDSALKDAWDSSEEELPLPAFAYIAMQSLGLDRNGFLEARKRSVVLARAAQGKSEVVPVGLPSGDGNETPWTQDDLPGAREPSAGDEALAAPLADGAAAVVVATPERARSLKKADAPRLVALVRATVESRKAPLAPVAALGALLSRTGRKASDLHVVEVDESLYVAPEAARKELSFPPERVNPRGGAHAYGHPGGACGLRALVAALAELSSRGSGLAAVAYGSGGGCALALLLEL
jgi:acetyl-CoA C-acetyltransferase